MPLTQEVEGRIDILGREPTTQATPNLTITPTSIETEVTTSTRSNFAKIMGYMERPDLLILDDWLSIYINNEHVFTGILKRATQSKDGEVTIELYDRFYDMHRLQITRQIETNIPTRDAAMEIIQNVFTDEYITDDPDNARPGSIYVAPADEFVGGSSLSKTAWGSGDSGDGLVDALKAIANKLVGALWTDKRGTLRLEPIPVEKYIELRYIVESDTGSGAESNIGRILVGSSAGSVGRSPAESYIESRLTAKGSALQEEIEAGREADTGGIPTISKPAGQSEQPSYEEQIQDEVVTSLDKTALSKMIADYLAADKGSITLAGTVDISPWNTVRIPQNSQILLPGNSEYAVKTLSQTLTTDNGWETTVTLGTDVLLLLNSLERPENIIEEEIERIESERSELTPTELTR